MGLHVEAVTGVGESVTMGKADDAMDGWVARDLTGDDPTHGEHGEGRVGCRTGGHGPGKQDPENNKGI